MAPPFDLDGWQIVFFSDFDASHMPWTSAEIRVPDELETTGVDSLILRTVSNGITIAVGFAPEGWRLPDPDRPDAWSAYFAIEGERANRFANGALAHLVAHKFLPSAAYKRIHTLAHSGGVTWSSAPLRAG